jgi:hypothetical protein
MAQQDRPDMRYTLFHFRRQTGRDEHTEFSAGRCLGWLIFALVSVIVGHFIVPPSFWHLLKWW